MANFFTGYLAKGSGSASFVEINYPGYARQPVTFGALVSGQTSNVEQVAFRAAQPWLPVTQDALFDAAGNAFLWWNTASAVTLGAGQALTINPGAIALYFDAVATSPLASLQYNSGSSVGIKPGGLVVKALSDIQIAAGVMSIQTDSQMSAPTALTNSFSGTIGTSATIIAPFSATRKSLMITNRTLNNETQDIGSSNVTVGGGIPLAPGGGFLFNGPGAAGPIYGITTVASSPFSCVEG